MKNLSILGTLLPCALTGVALFTILSFFSLFEKDKDSPSTKKKQPVTQFNPITTPPSRSNDLSVLDPTSRLQSGFVFITNELNELDTILHDSPNKRRMAYEDVTNRFPVTSRLSNIVDALQDLKHVQEETESMLEEQKKLTEKEKERRLRAEESLKAESKLREEAENEIHIYQSFVQRMRECDKCKDFFQC